MEVEVVAFALPNLFKKAIKAFLLERNKEGYGEQENFLSPSLSLLKKKPKLSSKYSLKTLFDKVIMAAILKTLEFTLTTNLCFLSLFSPINGGYFTKLDS